jgi:signal transduction histidine kinase
VARGQHPRLLDALGRRLVLSDSPQEHLPYIIDRFYQADASRATGGGSGLGLSIVRAIIERHDGEVLVRTTPDVETVFELVLPRLAQGPTTLRGG